MEEENNRVHRENPLQGAKIMIIIRKMKAKKKEILFMQSVLKILITFETDPLLDECKLRNRNQDQVFRALDY